MIEWMKMYRLLGEALQVFPENEPLSIVEMAIYKALLALMVDIHKYCLNEYEQQLANDLGYD